MKLIKLRRERYTENITAIQAAVITHGFDCSRAQAAELWRAYSESLSAGWVMCDGWSLGAIFRTVEPFIDPQNE